MFGDDNSSSSVDNLLRKKLTSPREQHEAQELSTLDVQWSSLMKGTWDIVCG